jgi:hypothetical protein
MRLSAKAATEKQKLKMNTAIARINIAIFSSGGASASDCSNPENCKASAFPNVSMAANCMRLQLACF